MSTRNLTNAIDDLVEIDDTSELYGIKRELKELMSPLGMIGWVIVVVLTIYWATKYFMMGGVLLYLAFLAYSIFKISTYNKGIKLDHDEYAGPMP